MKCSPININGAVGFACGRARLPPKCACGQRATKECDFIVSRAHSGNGTCDKPLCDRCAVRIGQNVDHCPDHPPAPGAQLTLGGL